MKQFYSLQEIKDEMEILKNSFDIVRLVDPILCQECSQKAEGNEFSPNGCYCFQVWNKNERCNNCISALVISQKGKSSKFEYIGDALYYIIARYVVVDHNKYSLECVSKLSSEYSKVLLDTERRTKRLLELYREIRLDELTGLYNRRYVLEKLQTMIIEARVNKKNNPVIAYIDINHLKYVNDSYGHNAGDAMIVAVADTMMKSFEQNENNFVARISGDVFLICMGDSNCEDMKTVINSIVMDVSRTAVADYPQLKPSISAGIAEFSEANTYDMIMELADKRLHKAKQSTGIKVICK